MVRGTQMAKPDIVKEINAFNNWTPGQLIQALGGSTKRAAEAKGVTQRTVQRYITTGKQTRRPGAAAQEKLNRAGRKTLGAVGITLDGTVAVGGKGEAYERDRTIDRTFS